jgi:hypothetical protein
LREGTCEIHFWELCMNENVCTLIILYLLYCFLTSIVALEKSEVLTLLGCLVFPFESLWNLLLVLNFMIMLV